MHTSLVDGETWASGIHEVPSSLELRTSSGRLTIASCTEVRMGANASLEFSGGAKLVAEGSQTRPIRFVRAGASAWGNLYATDTSTLSLASVTLEGGGTDQDTYRGASLVARGTAGSPSALLKVDHVTVKGSAGLGVGLFNARFDAASTELVVTGSGWFPVYLGADSLSSLPAGVYTGNFIDEILLQSVETAVYANDRPLHEAVIMHDRGVPYRVGSKGADLRIGDGYPTTAPGALTIEPGVTVKFFAGTSSRILIDAAKVGAAWVPRGKLIIAGTADKPVRLTSTASSPAPGDWTGVYFAHVVDPGSRIDHAVIEYAGGDSGTIGVCKASNTATNYDADCSIIFSLEGDLGAGQVVTNSRLANGLGCGVYRGWHGSDVDFRPTNTFVGLAGCSQSNLPPPGMQVCADVPCQ